MRQSSIPANVARAVQKDLPKVGALGEAEHGSDPPFDKPMIGMPHHLLDNIVQVLALPDPNSLISVSVVLLDGRGIGATFIDRG